MQGSITLQPGMRVRCVDACNANGCDLVRGGSHEVVCAVDDVVKVSGSDFWHDSIHFKPIIRVKANTVRPIGTALVSRTEHVGSIELGNKFTKHWVERVVSSRNSPFEP